MLTALRRRLADALAPARALLSQVSVVWYPAVERVDDDGDGLLFRVRPPRLESLGAWPPGWEPRLQVYADRYLIGWAEVRVAAPNMAGIERGSVALTTAGGDA